MDRIKAHALRAFGEIKSCRREILVDHMTFNQVVVGSIPTGLTTKIKHLTDTPLRSIFS
jgi:hypothetical protein